MADDFPSDISTTGTLIPNVPGSGRIDQTADQDWFAVTLTAGTKYRIDVTGIYDSHIGGLYDSTGAMIAGTTNYSGGIGRDARLWYVATETGTHYLSAGVAAGIAPQPGSTNTYSVTVHDDWDDHPADATTTARMVVNGSGFAGAIDEDGDVDWIAVTLDAGTPYRIALTGGDSTRSVSGVTQPLDVQIEGLYDSAGARITGPISGVGNSASTMFIPTAAGTYYLAAGSEGDARNGNYTAQVQSETVNHLAVNMPGFGTADVMGDQDFYAVTLTAGTKYRIDVTGLADTHIGGLYDSTGTIIAGTTNYSGGIGRDARIWYQATDTGTYYLSAGTAPGVLAPAGANRYQVTVRDQWDDYGSDPSTAPTLEVGSSMTGAIDEDGDTDWIAVTLAPGGAYRITLQGGESTRFVSGASLPLDVQIEGLYDSAGTRVLAPIPGTDSSAETLFLPTAAGTYYVSAGSEGAARNGNYTLSVVNEVTGTLQINTPGTTRVDSMGDQDWMAVTLTAGTKYRIDVEGTRDAHIGGLYDATGTMIAGTTNYSGGIGRDARIWYEATETGTYFVSAGIGPGVNPDPNDRHVTVTVADDWDDHPADITTTARVAPGGSIGAEIDELDDVDWIAVDMQAGRTYGINILGGDSTRFASGASIPLNTRLDGIFDATGARVAGPDSGDDRDVLTGFTATTTGTYYVAVGSEGTARDGLYTLRIDGDALSAGIDTTGALNPATNEMTGTINRGGDVDWVALSLLAGTSYEVAVTGTTLGDPGQVALFDATGTAVPASATTNAGNSSGLLFTPAADGTWFAAVSGETGADGGAFRLNLYTDQIAGDTTTTATVANVINGSGSGRILVGGDQDWHRMSLTAGQTYLIEVAGADGFDPAIMSLYDDTGAAIAGTAAGDVLRFTAGRSGDFFLGLGAEDGISGGNYQFTVRNDDFGTTPASAGRVAVGGAATGVIETYNDTDWFAVDLVAGERYSVDLKGSPSGDGTLGDPYLRGIYNPAGTLIPGTFNDDYNSLNSHVAFTAATTGTYHVTAGAYSYRTGSYTLSVLDLADDYAADITTTGVLPVNGSVTGHRETSGDSDWFAMTLEAGETYRVVMDGAGGLGLNLLLPAFAIRDAAGEGILGATKGAATTYQSRVEMLFTPEQAGTHFVATNSRWVDYIGTYELELQQLVTVTGTAGADWLSLPATGGENLVAIRGGDGADMMSFSGLDGGVHVNFATETVTARGGTHRFTAVLDSVEGVTGTSYNDVFTGSDGSDRARGLGGRDYFTGSGGARDIIDGGTSIDTLSYIGSSSGVSVSLFRGRGWGGDAEGDRISNIENLIGSHHDDIIWGDNLANQIQGGNGNDTITGAGGNDYILAGHGYDTIVYSGNQADYTILRNGIRTEVIHNGGGVDGHDVIGHAEVLQFADGNLIL
jgi:hypothetical protein